MAAHDHLASDSRRWHFDNRSQESMVLETVWEKQVVLNERPFNKRRREQSQHLRVEPNSTYWGVVTSECHRLFRGAVVQSRETARDTPQQQSLAQHAHTFCAWGRAGRREEMAGQEGVTDSRKPLRRRQLNSVSGLL